jgi:hypothetical protein
MNYYNIKKNIDGMNRRLDHLSCIRIKTKKLGKINQQYQKEEIFILFKDNAKHITVKMEIKVAIGSITANLVEGIY